MKFNIDTCDRICGNRYFPLTFVAIAALYVLFYSITTSPLYGFPICDSGVFKMMGHVLLSGGVPYVDYFDHKGPYLYLINAIGECISPSWGLFPIQVVWLSVSLMLWYKIARLFVRPSYSVIIVLITTILFIDVYEYGNHTEEWSLLPSSLCLYIALYYLVNNPLEKHRYWESLVYGLCFGLVFFIRPNDAVMVCGGVMTGIFLYIIFIQKRYVGALLNGLVFILGFGIMAAPWIVYFACHHALEDFYYGLIEFNVDYSGGIIYNICNINLISRLVWFCVILVVLEISAKKKILLWLSIPITLYILLLFGRFGYPHYFITAIPSVELLLITMLFCQKNKVIMNLAILLLLLSGDPRSGLERIRVTAKQIVTGTLGQEFTQMRASAKEVANLLYAVSKNERDSIWNYSDLFSSVFYQCGIIAQNPVPPIIVMQRFRFPEGKQEKLEISSSAPKWILKTSDSSYFFPEDSAFIAEHYRIVKECELSTYQLLKRKR